MKPLHIGLLVVGAALAGGLAVKMTQPPVYEAAAPRVSPPEPQPIKPAPPVTETVPVPPENPPTVATAPPPVYTESKPAPAKTSAAPPVRKWQRVQIAKAAPVAKSPAVKPTPVPVQTADATPAPSIAPPPYQAPPQPQPAPAPVQADVPAPSIESARVPDNPPAPMPLNPTPLQVTLRQGTQIAVRMDQTISSDHMSAGDTFQASLAEPLVADGFVIAEKGARVSGRVVEARNAGRLTGTSAIQLALSHVETSDGQRVAISTEPWVKQADTRNQEVAKIGGGAALGAIIGAIAGGGKGAAIGAGAGGAIGTGAAAASGGKPVTINSESVIRFRLSNKVLVTERPL